MLSSTTRGASLVLASLFLVSCAPSAPTQANISVAGDAPGHPRSPLIGGTNIAAHVQNFADNSVEGAPLPFQADLKAANVPLVRCLAYPDDHTKKRDFPLEWFDRRVKAVIASGAQPLLIQYIKPGLKYLDLSGKVGTGGTPATNLAFLLARYQKAPYNLKIQYWEVGNEPDNAVDYPIKSPGEYTGIFNAVDAQLKQSGSRDSAVLCGPALTFGYRLPWWGPLDSPAAKIMDAFLADCKDSVDVVTYHTYSNETEAKDPQWRQNILGKPRHLDNKENPNRSVTPGDAGDDSNASDVGLSALIAKMKTVKFGRKDVGIGVTEHSSGGSSPHTVQQGLWNLALTQYHLQNGSPFPTRLTNSFIFDWKAPQEVFAHYDAQGVKDPSYWALWMRNHLTGTRILPSQTAGNRNQWGNPNLLVLASRDDKNLWLEVINRGEQTVEESVQVDGVKLAATAKVHTLSATSTPDEATERAFGPNQKFTFAPYSATVFQISLRN